jgi:predicted RNA binding protein YcfA (HicA-like mRNA interferase family)
MPKRYSAKQILKSLQNQGFTIISQRGSHIKLRGIIDGKLQTAIVPNHKQIATGTLSSILRQAHISKQDLEDNL